MSQPEVSEVPSRDTETEEMIGLARYISNSLIPYGDTERAWQRISLTYASISEGPRTIISNVPVVVLDHQRPDTLFTGRIDGYYIKDRELWAIPSTHLSLEMTTRQNGRDRSRFMGEFAPYEAMQLPEPWSSVVSGDADFLHDYVEGDYQKVLGIILGGSEQPVIRSYRVLGLPSGFERIFRNGRLLTEEEIVDLRKKQQETRDAAMERVFMLDGFMDDAARAWLDRMGNAGDFFNELWHRTNTLPEVGEHNVRLAGIGVPGLKVMIRRELGEYYRKDVYNGAVTLEFSPIALYPDPEKPLYLDRIVVPAQAATARGILRVTVRVTGRGDRAVMHIDSGVRREVSNPDGSLDYVRDPNTHTVPFDTPAAVAVLVSRLGTYRSEKPSNASPVRADNPNIGRPKNPYENERDGRKPQKEKNRGRRPHGPHKRYSR